MKNTQINFHSLTLFVNVLVICLTMIIGFSVVAQESLVVPHVASEEYSQEYNTGSISFSIDNDGLLGKDRGYTNGIFYKFNSSSVVDVENLSPFAIKKIANWLPLGQKTNKGWAVTFGQQIWTPNDISSAIELENDRPYTGFLFVKASIFEFSQNIANKYSVMVGGVGPHAFAEKSQKAVHSVIGSKKPLGWDRQIENQAVFNLSYETQRLITRKEAWLEQNYDLALTGRVNIGNFQNEIALGSMLRWGSSLHSSFASVGFTPGNYIDPSVLSKSESGEFVYLGFEGRYRFNDITIDGARPKHLFDVHTEHWQSTISTGWVHYQASWGASLSIIASTAEYKEDIRKQNATASIEVFWRG
ncbi:MAG: lipid A deacylase LpxR family protein [Colwellia sp.]|nr:lipid A deacylase LpxR family protein [Colwellia sp.]